MVILFGATLSFLTPIGYQSNTLVWSMGGYRYGDFAAPRRAAHAGRHGGHGPACPDLLPIAVTPMRAVLCRAFGPPSSLVLDNVPSPQPGSGQVVVAVKACGVNFPDNLMIEGRYQFKPPMPFSPGGEVAGVVERVGEGVTSVRPGDRVIAVTGYGGFAEEVVTDAERLVPLPDGMDFPAGSALLFTYGTAQYALRDRGALEAGETLLVLGAAGGTGLAAVEVGSVMGARVIAVASSEEKLELCRERGAAETINYATEDLRPRIKDLTGGSGVDVVFDPVGGDHAEAAIRGMAWAAAIS